MFRIGIIEAGATCALIVLAMVIPLIVTRGYTRLSKRLNRLEKKIDKKN